MDKKLILINPHGFCAGVDRAVDAVRAALSKYDAPIYCYHEIVHNRQILDDLESDGVVFVESMSDIAARGVVVFSAHGVPPDTVRRAEARGLRIVDATCPFVRKVHREVRLYASEGRTVFLIGHREHQEVIGVLNEAPDSVVVLEKGEDAHAVMPPDPERVAVVTQTTLSYHDTNDILSILLSRFPALKQPGKSDICYATQNRQAGVREVAREVELVLVLGGANSSNSRRLVEVAESAGCKGKLISSSNDFEAMNLDGIRVLGVTSGASTPESFLKEILDLLASQGFTSIEERTVVPEDPKPFSLPPMP